MEALRALLEEKKKSAAGQFGGRGYVRQADIEGARLKRLREEEANELSHKDAAKRARLEAEQRALHRHDSGADREEDLPREEVIRRLRLLGQPITLFGEEDAARAARLRRVQEDYQAQDEHADGQQGNLMLALQRGELGRKKAASAGAASAAAREKDKAERQGDADAEAGANAAEDEEPEDETTAAFRRAAEAVKEKREEEAMCVEHRIYKYLKRWFAEWGRDLDTRPDDAKASQSGYQMDLVYAQTEQYLKPLWKDLRRREMLPELVAGLYMIVQAVQQRNYLQAYDIYVRLAIGNSPWPIGVTSVGIHERSAREKISHVMNGAAHVMNNEATRKYLQALKRLLTFMQRAHPTDPSRSVEFDGYKDAGRGVAGGGSDKTALLEAHRRGETVETLRLEPAPHFHESDGSVMVPKKWMNILSKSEVFTKPGQADSTGAVKTPPRSPLQRA